MTTPFQKSGVKVLKKCKECGIYPSAFTAPGWYGSTDAVYMCPKCLNRIESPCEFDDALKQWNKANGLDEHDESTWHDGFCDPCQHVIEFRQDSRCGPVYYRCSRCGSGGPFQA